jgi:hypothetical protein
VAAFSLPASEYRKHLLSERPEWERRMAAANRVEEVVASVAGAAAVLLGVSGILGGLGILAYQALIWLQTGSWTAYKFAAFWLWIGVQEPDFPQWRGVQKIIVEAFDMPLSAGLMGLGAVAVFIGSRVLDHR